MAEPKRDDDALVETGARVLFEQTEMRGSVDSPYGWEWLDPGKERYRSLARAVIAAVRPLIEAELLNAIANPSDGMLAALVPEPVHLYPARGEEYIKLVQSAVAIDRLVMRQKCMDIAAAIRQGQIDEGEK